MIAVDTNLVVRYLTGDEPAQAARVQAMFERDTIFVGMAVLLETCWVLRSRFDIPHAGQLKALRALTGLRHVVVEEPELVERVLEWMEEGLDFADALHLAKAGHCESLTTFDRDFIKIARRLDSIPVREP